MYYEQVLGAEVAIGAWSEIRTVEKVCDEVSDCNVRRGFDRIDGGAKNKESQSRKTFGLE